MGYDMGYHFDPGEEYDKEELLKRLVNAGAELVQWEDGTRDVFFGPVGIWFVESPEKIAKGEWLWSRMPPGEEWLIDFVELAGKLGCTLFDPQTGKSITPVRMKEALADREAGQRLISSLLGAAVGEHDEPIDH